MCRLVKKHEVHTSYSVEGLPQDFVQNEMKGVIGFAVDVTRVDASYKLSQNRNKRSCPPSLRMIQYRPLDRLRKQPIGDSSNGRTAVSGTVGSGSNPLSPARKKDPRKRVFFLPKSHADYNE